MTRLQVSLGRLSFLFYILLWLPVCLTTWFLGCGLMVMGLAWDLITGLPLFTSSFHGDTLIDSVNRLEKRLNKFYKSILCL